jgi:DUF1680 family protein
MSATRILTTVFFMLVSFWGIAQQASVHVGPVNFSKVIINDDFWKPKIDKVATKTLDACIYQTEVNTGRIRNFEKVARGKGEKHEGIFYDDSDVYKAIEAMAYAIKLTGNKALEQKADEWIDKIAAAQQADGYLNTYYTLTGLDQRWTDMDKHEDYCGGHMVEAAVAYFDATGKKKVLDVSKGWADHFDATFGPGKRNWVTGHQELELALVKLYKVTGEKRYLTLADWLLSERGKNHGVGSQWKNGKGTDYSQDLLPVKEQSEITGHAVRAMYLYTGAADVAAHTGDQDYLTAMRRVWEDVVFRNMYITGAIGSAGKNEGFSKDYDLPNEQAYCETCASVGMVFWNQRMNSLTGKAEYIDVLERSLYNGALDGLSLSGDRFFYGNPLASQGNHNRREWFGTACCPSNIARLITSVGGYIYGQESNKIYINLFVGSESSFDLAASTMKIKTSTAYPWQGNVSCAISMSKKEKASIAFRIPGWLRNTPAPGNLYSFLNQSAASPTILVNGKLVAFKEENGYAIIEKEWADGDKVEYSRPMEVRKIAARKELVDNNYRMALQRGPIVYCVEGADNNGKAWNIFSPATAKFETENFNVLDEKVVSLVSTLPVIQIDAEGQSTKTVNQKVRAIPYYTWCNRGKNPMQVWLPTVYKDIKINY